MMNQIRSMIQLCIYSYLFDVLNDDTVNDIKTELSELMENELSVVAHNVDVFPVEVNNVVHISANITFKLVKSNKVHRIIINTLHI